MIKIIELKGADIEATVKGIRAEISDPSNEAVASVREIVERVREKGDEALFEYTKRFDKWEAGPSAIRVTSSEIEEALEEVSDVLIDDLKTAAERVRIFHEKKMPEGHMFTDSLGNELGWAIRPLERVGVYVPGGKAVYPSTVLMTVIPALVAGVDEVVIATPTPGGGINPVVLAAAKVSGVDTIYKIGGAQAVAALAFGTETIPKVDKIVGPGNIYVALAKKFVYGTVDIDMIAGPSEVLIIADGSCPASWVASDLLAQAEHDELAVPLVVTTSGEYAEELSREVDERCRRLERNDIAGASIENQGRIFVVDSLDDALRVANAVAPEHLEICTEDPKALLPSIKHAGAIFLGSLSTEAFGDYIAGPSHVLPTGGAARFSSPLGVHDFLRMPSVISVSSDGLDALGQSVMNLAYSEGLEAHALSVKVRLDEKG